MFLSKVFDIADAIGVRKYDQYTVQLTSGYIVGYVDADNGVSTIEDNIKQLIHEKFMSLVNNKEDIVILNIDDKFIVIGFRTLDRQILQDIKDIFKAEKTHYDIATHFHNGKCEILNIRSDDYLPHGVNSMITKFTSLKALTISSERSIRIDLSKFTELVYLDISASRNFITNNDIQHLQDKLVILCCTMTEMNLDVSNFTKLRVMYSCMSQYVNQSPPNCICSKSVKWDSQEDILPHMKHVYVNNPSADTMNGIFMCCPNLQYLVIKNTRLHDRCPASLHIGLALPRSFIKLTATGYSIVQIANLDHRTYSKSATGCKNMVSNPPSLQTIQYMKMMTAPVKIGSDSLIELIAGKFPS